MEVGFLNNNKTKHSLRCGMPIRSAWVGQTGPDLGSSRISGNSSAAGMTLWMVRFKKSGRNTSKICNDCISVPHLRCVASDGTITIRLITSKSRVAPLENTEQKKKKMTIPELSGALLLSHIYEKFVQWLSQDQRFWPQASKRPGEEVDPAQFEERSTPAFPTQGTPPNKVFVLRSSYLELQRIVAWFLRFKFNALSPDRLARRSGPLSHEELEQALLVLVRLAQQDCFPEEVHDLENHGEVKPSSRIKSLNPQLTAGVLRVGGRLSNAPVSENRKHPVILDHRHPLAIAIARHYHNTYYHAGQQLLISSIRAKFWPTNAHSLARMVIHECGVCFRRKPKVVEQLMADLPVERVTPSAPFLKVGMDYCGPFLTSPVKCYVALFVCLAVKAIHLELVADLTTQALTAAFRRFVARRGKPQLVMCDNATTFVGANRELKELFRKLNEQQFQDAVVREAPNNDIEFHFIPPRTPNFGGNTFEFP
ncbi:uncharacterized protein LOC135702358 [Ochlerotatus camptorhynchus]|uniref:uncharacterized protein LOC135702358 n=1 Tax=Ochlerotatus camptorhynchus TaxID=644619 RepID=UPI0031DB173B